MHLDMHFIKLIFFDFDIIKPFKNNIIKCCVQNISFDMIIKCISCVHSLNHGTNPFKMQNMNDFTNLYLKNHFQFTFHYLDNTIDLQSMIKRFDAIF